MNKKHYIFGAMLIFFISCSSDEPVSSEEQTTSIDNALAEQNRWIYSQMNLYYLWREDLPDSLSCNFNQNTKDFFKEILSPKDRFSYLTTNTNYTSNQSKWGFAYQLYEDKTGERAYYVLYTLNKNDNITEGDWLHYEYEDASGIHFSKIRLTDNGLFEKLSCSDFVLSNLGNISNSTSILRDSIYHINDMSIGYLCYLEFDDAKELKPTIKYFKDNNISELILDLRYNPGGYVSTCQYLCNCIVNESGYGNIFQQCSYNDILSAYYKSTTGSEFTFSFYKQPTFSSATSIGLGVDGLNLKRLFVLTSAHTASASEATIICLRPYMDIIIIGETTVGKGVGSRNYANNKFKYSIQPIVMRYYNALKETTPDEGIEPDYFIPEGYSIAKKEIGNIEEPLLNKALSLIAPSKFKNVYSRSNYNFDFDKLLTPIGEPSYVTEFNNKHYNENN